MASMFFGDGGIQSEVVTAPNAQDFSVLREESAFTCGPSAGYDPLPFSRGQIENLATSRVKDRVQEEHAMQKVTPVTS